VLTIAGDIVDPATAEQLVTGAVERFGRVDTLINNAGGFIAKPFTQYTATDYALINRSVVAAASSPTMFAVEPPPYLSR
jgi:NADP-dependent 3-hydroxy acid dehydrogenase YdfG